MVLLNLETKTEASLLIRTKGPVKVTQMVEDRSWQDYSQFSPLPRVVLRAPGPTLSQPSMNGEGLSGSFRVSLECLPPFLSLQGCSSRLEEMGELLLPQCLQRPLMAQLRALQQGQERPAGSKL